MEIMHGHEMGMGMRMGMGGSMCVFGFGLRRSVGRTAERSNMNNFTCIPRECLAREGIKLVLDDGHGNDV